VDAPLTASPAELALRAIVDRARDLAYDLRLEQVRRWKAQHPGGKALGYLPLYAPRELLHAAGILPVGLLGGGDKVDIVRGDAFYQSYICHIPRSTIELALDGAYDALDGVLFPSTCDVIRNLSGMWQVLFPGKFVRYLDVPQNFDADVGGRFWAGELRRLAQELGELTGRPVTDAALAASIERHDRHRARIEELYTLRAEAPWLAPASEAYCVLRAGLILDVDEHEALVREYLAAARASGRRPLDNARIVLRGAFCEQPPLDLIRTLERAGCSIVDDDWLLALRWHSGPVAAPGDPYEALANAFLKLSPACPSMYLAAGKKGDALLDQPMTQGAARLAGVPSSSFLYSENTGQLQVIREQAGTFADSIRLT
jgi:benzoyl-CoA reductase subunit C